MQVLCVQFTMSQLRLCVCLLVCLAIRSVQGDSEDELSVDVKAKQPCSSLSCSERVCVTDLKCGRGEVLEENVSVCGCCPGCVVKLALGEPCSPSVGPSCATGLECTNNVCAPITVSDGSCLSLQQPSAYWKPACLPDGSFAPKQCKGEKLTGRCFCYSEEGKRIFGQEWWSKAQNMTCSCSRKVSDLQKTRKDVTLHCDERGNYEALQCDNELCWCAEELTGDPITDIVPETLVTILPCYNASILGSQYLRQCESMSIVQARIAMEMKYHGTNYIRPTRLFCDYDGSYGNYQIDLNQILYCSWKDASRLGSWQTQVTEIAKINCNCARDSQYYKDSGLELSLQCNGNGNYERKQESEGQWFCVDPDGFPIMEPVESIGECPEWSPFVEQQSQSAT